MQKLGRPFILGLDFQRIHKIGMHWSDAGDIMLIYDEQILVESVETSVSGLKILTRCHVDLQSKTLIILNAKTDITNIEHLYDMQFNDLLGDKYSDIIYVSQAQELGYSIDEMVCK